MDKLDRILKAHVATGDRTKDRILGAAFVVVNRDGKYHGGQLHTHSERLLIRLEVIYEGAAGRTGISPDAPAFTANSCSWVASMTKIITCTCIMQLVEKNLINLDDDMRQIVPQLARMQVLQGFDGNDVPILNDNTRPITLR